MDQIRQHLLNISNPDAKIRGEAEKALTELSKYPNVVVAMQDLFVDTHSYVTKSSAIYYNRTLTNNYCEASYIQYHETIVKNLLKNMSKVSLLSSLVGIIIKNEDNFELINHLIEEAKYYLTTMDNINLKSSLLFYLELIKFEKENDKIEINPIFRSIRDDLLNILLKKVRESDYEICFLIMKIFKKVKVKYDYDFLNDDYFYMSMIKFIVDVLNIEYVPNRKFVTFLIYSIDYMKECMLKAFNSAFKRELRTFIFSDEILNRVLGNVVSIMFNENILHALLDSSSAEEIKLDNLLTTCCNFLSKTYIDKDRLFKHMIPVIKPLIFKFIIPSISYNDRDEELFLYDSNAYVMERYSYYSKDYKDNAIVLFEEIMDKLAKINDPNFNYIDDIVVNFFEFLIEYKKNPTLLNSKSKYSIMCLFANVPNHLQVYLDKYLRDHLLPELSSSNDFLRSQALFTIRYFDSKELSQDILEYALSHVLQNTQNEKFVIKTDACIATEFFFENEVFNQKISTHIPYVVNMLFEIQKTCSLEAINDLFETIINYFPDQMFDYAPKMTQNICLMIEKGLKEPTDESFNIINGYLNTLFVLILKFQERENYRDTVLILYNSFAGIIAHIFREKLTDLYTEALNLLGQTIFCLQSVDESMWFIVDCIMSIQKHEKLSFSQEIVFVLDNYISFGNNDAILKRIGIFIVLIEDLCIAPDGDFYEEDYIEGIKLIESLIISLNTKISSYIGKILETISTYKQKVFKDYNIATIHYFSCIINLLIIDFENTIIHMERYTPFNLFIDELYKHRKLMKRKIDTILIITMVGLIMRKYRNGSNCGFVLHPLEEVCFPPEKVNDYFIRLAHNNTNNLISDLESKGMVQHSKLGTLFATAIKHYPIAAERRKKLLAYDEDDESMDMDYDDLLDEDTESAYMLDPINIDAFVKDCIANSTPIGEKIYNSLKGSHKEFLFQYIQKIFNT